MMCSICKTKDSNPTVNTDYICPACVKRWNDNHEAYKRGDFPLRTHRFINGVEIITWEYYDGTVAGDDVNGKCVPRVKE